MPINALSPYQNKFINRKCFILQVDHQSTRHQQIGYPTLDESKGRRKAVQRGADGSERNRMKVIWRLLFAGGNQGNGIQWTSGRILQSIGGESGELCRVFLILHPQVYFISKAQIKLARKQYSTVKNDYEISFDNNTQIELVSLIR